MDLNRVHNTLTVKPHEVFMSGVCLPKVNISALLGNGMATYFLKLTSACEPAERVLLHFSHFRQGLCQSLPSEVTLSAETQR